MIKLTLTLGTLVLPIFFIACNTAAGGLENSSSGREPWTEQQLMAPSELAERMQKRDPMLPVIFDIGPSGTIKGAVEIGPAREEENLAKLRARLGDLPKDTTVVIYCGCCPFGDCPNIRPAFRLLTSMGFTHPKLLNLPQNLKVDWINKNYPMDK